MSESILERWVQTIAKPLLLLGVRGGLITSVASQKRELMAVAYHSLGTLHETTKLLFLPVHESFRNVVALENHLELFPRNPDIKATHLLEVLPPSG